ncbi:YceI family protein [soil metagenome]
MLRLLPWLALLVVVAFPAPAAIAAGLATYSLDPVHTRVLFAVEHAGFSQALGTVSGSTGTLRFDPDDWTTATLQAEVPLHRLDLGDARWNRATLARNLLDVDAHPVARFTSTHVEPLAADRARVHGLLELRGISREVVLDVRLNALKRHPLPPFRRTAGFSATTTLSRADFGITAWKSVVGDTVKLRIEAEATRTQGDGGDTLEETPAADHTPEQAAEAAADTGDAPVAEPEAKPQAVAAEPPCC